MTTPVAKNKIGKVAVTTAGTGEENVLSLIKKGGPQFAMALPKHLDSDRFVRIALTEVRKNPKLLNCKPESLMGALLTSASLGLEPGVLGQAYLIPYGTEVNFQISYKGMIELSRRSGNLQDIYAYVVYENEEFEITYGLDRNLKHKPNFKDPGEIIGVYAVAKLKDGGEAFEFMTLKQIEEHKKKFSKTSNYGPWVTDLEAMAKKTVVKQLMKWLPVSTDFLESMHRENGINRVDVSKVGKTEELNISFEEIKPANVIEAKCKQEDLVELLDSATKVGLDMKKVALENGYDLDNLTVSELDFLQNIVDEKIAEKM